MDEKLLRKRINRIAYMMAALFLAIHIGLLVLFAIGGVMPMVYVNIGSILFYALMLFFIRKSLLTGFAVASYIEINAHMLLAILYCGWEPGFQIPLIGIVILLFFSEYVARTLRIKYIPSVFLAPLAAIVYILGYVLSSNYPAPYVLPSEVILIFQVLWAVIVFSVMTIILHIFVTTTTRSQSELTNEVVHDKLTGLPNRYYMASLFQKVEEEGERHRRWVAIADIDDFKLINDTHGHNYGDYVLKTIASLLEGISPEIVVCRWGGEEFLIVGDESTDPQEELEDFRKAVESYPFEYEGERMGLTVTVGYSYKKKDQSIDEWINDADKLLYKGKENGKNQVCR